jgi:hypothetical protein
MSKLYDFPAKGKLQTLAAKEENGRKGTLIGANRH